MTDLFDAGLPEPHTNRLWYGDNLTVMTDMMRKNSVDLIYLDPPFNSNRRYNLLYSKVTGLPVPEQDEAFCDTWELTPEKEDMVTRMPIVFRDYGLDEGLITFWKTWIDALRNTQPKLLAYMVYMTYRLLAMRSLLRPHGSLWLHCDPTASHYIKVMLDGIFGHDNFRNEVIWRRTFGHSDARSMGAVHDTLFHYSKSSNFTSNPQYSDYDEAYIARRYRHKEADGRRWMDDNLSAKGLQGGGYKYEYRGVEIVMAGAV